MERQQCNSLQNFDEPKSDILKKILLKSNSGIVNANFSHNTTQHNVLLNTLRAPISSSMIVSSVQASQNSIPITHNLVTHSIAPMKIHTNSNPYPLQLSTVHVPVQIPGSTSNINVPVQLSGPTSSMPLQITPVSLPIQVSGTTNVPVQLPAGETINVPLQIPASQSIQIPTLPSMPLLQNPNQSLHSSIFHVHMGSNPRQTNLDGSDMTMSSPQLQIQDSGVQMKMNNPTSVSQVPMGTSSVMQLPSSSNNIQLALPSNGSTGTVQLRGAPRAVPHMVYIQTPNGLKPVTSTEVISQASTSGNPPQIIVRRPGTSSSNIHLISNVSTKPNIAPKVTHNKSILAPVNSTQPIVIQKPKVPVSIAPSSQGKQAIAYLGSVKKPNSKNLSDNQSILISNNQPNVTANNQKLFLTPMNMPKIQNTKFILPVTLPATMASKGPIINLQIANGQIQNDPQGNITVMRDTGMETTEMPPLQPLGKVGNINGKDNNSVTQSPKGDKAFAFSISGSRAEPTGEQGEYTLSIPETNASMNDDIYTVSIANEDGVHSREKSFTLAIPEKGKSLLNRNMSHMDRNEMPGPVAIAAPAILRRSNSDNSDRKTVNANIKRRISLCTENYSNKNLKMNLAQQRAIEKLTDSHESQINDDHRVPSLFCDEKLDKDLEAKVNMVESDPEDNKQESSRDMYYPKVDQNDGLYRVKRESLQGTLEEDPPGLIWNNGVALLQGSDLQFQTNEFGLIDLIDANDHEELIPNPKYHTPLKQRIERNSRDKKPTSPEDMYRCDGCGCHGMAAEFITPNFCSLTCQSEVLKAIQKKKDKERVEIMKKRNKMKKLLMRKQSDSDIVIDSIPPEISEGSLLKVGEDLIENEKYPWMCGKNGFSWMRYLEVCKAKAAPVKLFKDPFPYNRNGFKVGMRMEAIDPEHPSLFCVVSVAEVQGYRMRLHFDEYPDVYDYWVNADCPDIFPAGWCEKNGRVLKPPASYNLSGFSWPLYLKSVRAVAAPKHLFMHITSSIFKPNCFRVGMKLEAEDRKNELVCVASITDMMDNRMLINFDSWDEMYDYWVDPSSPYIHPVGWAEDNGLPLTPPNYYKDPETFSWATYLAEAGVSAAPPRAFKTRPPQGFKIGMKLEVVDPRVPFLIRVASVADVKGHQVKILFDGWPDELASWMDDDSPDIHPVGWCLKTGHPLEPPLTAEELAIQGSCGVSGCRGLGSVRGGPHKQHNAASTCPYRRRAKRPDRLDPPHSEQRYFSTSSAICGPHKQHNAASTCPYRRRAKRPDRLDPPHSEQRYFSTSSAICGPHKQHNAASTCPYRRRAKRPDRLDPPHSEQRYFSTSSAICGPHKQHNAASTCPYRRRAKRPDRLDPPHSEQRYFSTSSAICGPHKQHNAASTCPYRRRAKRPDRLDPPHSEQRYFSTSSAICGPHKQHNAASTCPYRRRAKRPDRLDPPHSEQRYFSTSSAICGPHKQHNAASTCPYRRRAKRPDRLDPPHSEQRYFSTSSAICGPHKQHNAASTCPYRRRAKRPDRLDPPHSEQRYFSTSSAICGPHKQHNAASTCPYRRRAKRPDRLDPPHSEQRYFSTSSAICGPHKQHNAASTCPYRRRAKRPDRLDPPHSEQRYFSTSSAICGPHKQHNAASTYPYRRRAKRPDRLDPPHSEQRYFSTSSAICGPHKQHNAASTCPYRRRAKRPDRLDPPHSEQRYFSTSSAICGPHKQHNAASTCPYRRRAKRPDRLDPPHSEQRYFSTSSAICGPHKQHNAASTCPYRRRAKRPDRLDPPHSEQRYFSTSSAICGPHKQHNAASTCPYRRRAKRPDRLDPPHSEQRYFSTSSAICGPHKQHNAASTCPYRRRAKRPDRLDPPHSEQRFYSKSSKSVHTSTPTSDITKDKDRSVRGRPPKHKRVEEVKNNLVSEDESESSGGGGKRWRGSEGSARDTRDDTRDTRDDTQDAQDDTREAPDDTREAQDDTQDTRDGKEPDEGDAPEQRPMPRAHLQRHIDELDLPADPTAWTEKEVGVLVERVGGAAAGAAARAARLRGAELVMASRDELAACLRLRLGPAVKVYAAVRLLRSHSACRAPS